MSIGFLIGDQTDAVIWRSPIKFKVIRQLLGDVAWGGLDYLVVDCPPGPGGERLRLPSWIGGPAAARCGDAPRELAIADVRRCVLFSGKPNYPWRVYTKT